MTIIKNIERADEIVDYILWNLRDMGTIDHRYDELESKMNQIL